MNNSWNFPGHEYFQINISSVNSKKIKVACLKMRINHKYEIVKTSKVNTKNI